VVLKVEVIDQEPLEEKRLPRHVDERLGIEFRTSLAIRNATKPSITSPFLDFLPLPGAHASHAELKISIGKFQASLRFSRPHQQTQQRKELFHNQGDEDI